MKPKKKEKKKEVVYWYSEMFIIPEPSPDAFDKKKKPKYWFFNKNQYFLYSKLDVVLDPYFKSIANTFFYKNVYTVGIIKNFTKFSFIIKFDFFWSMSSVISFYNFSSFGLFLAKIFFSEKKFKFINKLVFKDFFTYFMNYNKPFVWWKGKRYIGKKWGTALVLIWWAIFWQIFYENLGVPFEFSFDEKKNFKIAEVDPNDDWYYWPTWRLNLLGLSTHSGKISANFTFEKKEIVDWFDHIKRVIEKFIWFWIFKQIYIWRSKLLELFQKNWLIFDPEFIISKKNKKFYPYLQPKIYIGKLNYFFNFDFIYEEHDKIYTYIDNFIINSVNKDIYDFLSFHARIPNYDLCFSEKINQNWLVWVENDIKMISLNKYIKYDWVKLYFEEKTTPFDNLDSKNLNKKIFKEFQNSYSEIRLYTLPKFLQLLFVILSFPKVDKYLLEKFIINPILENHDQFNELLIKPWQYDDFYYKWLNLFKTELFQSLKLKKIKDYPIFIHKLFHKNLEAFLGNKITHDLQYEVDKFKFFNTIYLAEIHKNWFSNLKLSQAITPASLLTIQYASIPKKNFLTKKLEKKYSIIVIFNIYFFFNKITKKNKLALAERIFLWNFLFLISKTKRIFRNVNFNLTNLSIRYTLWFEVYAIKPNKLKYFNNIEEYVKWFSNSFDPSIEKSLPKEKLIDLNYCLPEVVYINREKLYNKVIFNSKENLKYWKKNSEFLWNFYLKKIYKKTYRDFVVSVLTPWFWLNQFVKNINLTKSAINNFFFFFLKKNTFWFYQNTFWFNYNIYYIDKYTCFKLIKIYFLSNNIFLNQKQIMYCWLKKYDKTKFS